MTVRVVDRHEKQDHIVQNPGGCFRDRDVAQQGETGIFSVWFTRVDACLDQYNGFSLLAGGFRRERLGF